MSILEKIGVPGEYINIIAQLFVNNQAFPILTGKHKVKISMSSGLRQGCPLSPILFLLALDPLLSDLETVMGTSQGAWCDDLVISFGCWSVVPTFLGKIDAYNKASGGSSNTLKSLFISTTDSKFPVTLPGHWSRSRLVDRYKHLGVLRGRSVTVQDVFADAMQSLRDRVMLYSPFKSSYSLQNRVIISNAFLTSVLSYLCQFFLLDPRDELEVERLISDWTVPGRRLKYDYLCAPTRGAGLATPLRDVYKSNIALILRGKSSFPSPPVPTVAVLVEPGMDVVYPHVHESMHTDTHTCAASDLFSGFADAAPPLDTDCRALYGTMADGDTTVASELSLKLRGSSGRVKRDRTSASCIASIILDNCKGLPHNLPRKLRNHLFLLVHNALATRARTRWHHQAVTHCKLCGGGTEDLEHLHVRCPVALSAKSIILANHPDPSKLMALRLADACDFVMQSTDYTSSERLAFLAFSLAIWNVRQGIQDNDRHSVVSLGRSVADSFRTLLAEATRPRKSKHRDRANEKSCFINIWNGLPAFSVRAFTDGSSLGNPGPAGCGVVYQWPGGPRKYTSMYLHHRVSNNVAELHGIRVVCNLIKAELLESPRARTPQVFIFVDNQFAIKAANGQSRIRANKALVTLVQQSLEALRKITPVTLVWVPGHAGIGGNDVADALAKRGAHGISSDHAPPTTPHRFVTTPSQARPPRQEIKEEKTHEAFPSRPTTSTGPRQSKRLRPSPPMVEGIDFSLAQGSRKKQKRTVAPVSCPHGIMFDYSTANAAVDLPALSCSDCKKSSQDAINIPHQHTEFFYAMHDPYDDHYDPIEHELDDASDHAPSGTNPGSPRLSRIDHDVQNDLSFAI